MAAFVLLMLLPLIMATVFRGAIVSRKENEILGDLDKLQAYETDLLKRRGGQQAIKNQIQNYYGKKNLHVPVILLTIFYTIGFLLYWSYLNATYGDGLPEFFSNALLLAARPIMIVFIGVYLFNTGTLIRRLYLARFNRTCLLDLDQPISANNWIVHSFGNGSRYRKPA